jgi:hypothetical protein
MWRAPAHIASSQLECKDRLVRGFAIVAALLCLACTAPTAFGQLRRSDTPPADAPLDAIKALAFKAADRMADRCRPDSCMDANEYSIDSCTRRAARRWLCDYSVYGWTFDAREPVGDFACSRPALVTFDRGGGVGARSTGKTSCRDDPHVNQTYPWPKSYCKAMPRPGGGVIVMCVDVAAPPHRTLHQPLRRRGSLPDTLPIRSGA